MRRKKTLTSQPLSQRVSRVNKVPTQEELEHFIIKWNNANPLDYFWRKKYNIAFGSEEHKRVNFLDQAIDYHEERLMKKHRENLTKLQDKEDDTLLGLEADKELVNMSESSIDKEFEDLNIEDFLEPDINSTENILKDK